MENAAQGTAPAVPAVIDTAAHTAATSPRNDLPEPTDAQKAAGNYPKGHVKLAGMDLAIENPAESVRRNKPGSPVKWETTMKHHYGYIKGTIGNDKDHVDAFVKPDTPLDYSGTVYVVDQVDPDTGRFDEHKILIGFDNPVQARAAYQANYAKGWKGLKAITAMPMAEFKTWVYDGPKNKELAQEKAAGSDPAAGKWFGTQEKAAEKLAAMGLTGTHEVVREGMRFELRKKAAKPEGGYTLVSAMNDLMDVRAKIEAQGQVSDDRLVQREKQLAKIVKELEASAAPAPQVKTDKAEMRPYRKPDGSIGYEAVPIVEEPKAAKRAPAEVVDNTATNPGEYLVRDAGTNLARFVLKDGRASAIKHFFESQGTRDFALESINEFIAKQTKAPKPKTPQLPGPFEDAVKGVGYVLPTFATNGAAKAKSEPAPAQPKPEPAKQPDALKEREKAAKAKMLGAAAKLANLLSKNTRANITPEQEQAMLPIVIELFEGAMDLGYVKFKQAARYVREFIAGAIDQDAADSIPIDTLQGAYIATARRHKDKAITPKAEVIAVESVDELTDPLETEPEKADTATNQEPAAPDEPQETLLGANNDPGTNAADDGELLVDAVPQPGPSDGQGGSSEAGDGLRPPDAQGNGATQDDRTGRGNSLDGDTQPVLPGTPAEVRPLADGPVGRTEERPNQLSGDNPGNFAITYDLRLGEGTDGQKIKANLDAIRTLRTLQKENRFPTPDEQRIMARYVGWGGLKSVFDTNKKDATDLYGKAQRELKELLNAREYRAANGSIRNAHYTAQGIVDGMWRVVRHMGFNGGRALEPTVGIGNFIGLQPADMAGSTEWHAAELDAVTGHMAARLYPEANILAATGFQDAPFADGVFDLAIGNPPFGAQTIDDKSPQRKHLSGMKIHNYIIAKAGMHLRPGGVMSMVVTHRFLDTANPEARAELAGNFKFLGAFRLPNDAFAANAGTEVVTDVIFLQKLRDDEARDRSASWLDVNGSINVDGADIRVNRYYQDNPTHILGRSANDGTMYAGRKSEEGAPGEYTVHSDGRDLGKAIDDLISTGFKDMAGIMKRTDADSNAAPAMLAQSDLPVGGVLLDDEGKIMRRELDDDAGNAVVNEITPETLWKDQAAEWQALQGAMVDIKKRATSGRGITTVDAAEFLSLAQFTYKADGTQKPKPTKAEAAVYKLVDDLARPASFKWTHDEGGVQIGLTLARKQLGVDGHKSLKGMLDLRNRALRLIRAEQSDDPKMEDLRKDLNRAYDAFVKANGYLSDPRNSNLLDGDIGVEAGLESKFEPAISAEVSKSTGVPARKASATKSDILKQRVNFPYKEITSAESPADALNVSLSEHGKVDLPYMAKITGKSIMEVTNSLMSGEDPQLFRDPESGQLVEAERYLSGNVRHKLEVARANGEKANIKALEKVQPAPKVRSQVKPNIRGMWIPEEIFSDFLESIGYQSPKISIIASQGMMSASGDMRQLSDFGIQFRHTRATPMDMFNAAASGKPLTIWEKDADGKRYKNDAMTKEVTALVDRMSKMFQDWAYSDDGRADRIVAAFNEKMNTHVPRSYDGVRYLRQVGANPSIKLRRTQKNAAWRMIQEKTMLAHHVVGAGKTFTLIAGVMERRRMGLSRKPMIAVPNHLVVQWARDFYKLYPAAKVLAATPADFARKNRRRLLARIATGDYDAIIIGHSSLGFIETPADDMRQIVDEKLAGLKDALATARANKESKRTLGQIEDRIDRYEQRLKDLAERPTDEIGIDFKSMGIDHLSVDEAHEFKNLEYSTSGDRVKGMNDPNGSKKAFDLYAKIRGLLGRDGGVVFATGTPVSNSLVEIYTVMSYLAHEELKLRNQEHFDSWSGAYAATETKLEYTSTQKLKPARVLTGLNNLSALRQLYEQFADIITMADLKRMYTEEKIEENRANGTNVRTDFPVPKVRNGARQLVSGPATPSQVEYMDYLVARMGAIEANKSNKAYPSIDNPLNVLTDARKMSLDIRIVDPMAQRDENGKVMRAARLIKKNYDDSMADRGTQLVFCDLSTPAKTAAKEARRMVGDTLKVLVGDKKAKEAKARHLDGKTFEQQWAFLREQADRMIEDTNTDEKRRDEISAYMEGIEDPEATMLTADIGFSVYDDMRGVLMDMGIPESEIAFIHDYNTPEQKEKLFDRVNNGYVRVLLGSTMKMGAGTNAQRRMVALHHMDAPWRPSDVEQREGRIIRQGNELYARDPDGFEVGIDAYSTENTSDTVMWQVLQRKAGAIEQFLEGGLDSTEEEGTDSNQYAEFMASSTGNPVFRLKLEAERRVTDLNAEISGALIVRSNAASFMNTYQVDRIKTVATLDAAKSATFTGASYGGESGSVEEYTAAMKEAQDAYLERYAAYQEKRAAAETAVAAWEMQPEETRGEKPKVPTAPSKPNLMATSVQSKSGFARAIALALKEARPDKQNAITLNDKAKIVIEGAVYETNGGSINTWAATIVAGGKRFRLSAGEGNKATDSLKLIQDLTPANIQSEIDGEVRSAQSQIEYLDERKKTEAKRAGIVVDTSKLDLAKDELDWYEMQVRFAEIESDIRRSSRPNRYIAADKRRDLGQVRKIDRAPVQTIEVDGVTYTTTGLQDARGNNADMQATRDSDGLPVVINEKKVMGDKGTLTGEVTRLVIPQPSSIPFTPKAGNSTNLRQTGAPEGNDTDVVFNRKDDAPFYSALSREIGAINAKAQAGPGWAMNIAGLVKAGKVKQDEVNWTGVLDWLRLQEGKVTRDQVAQYLDANGVQVEETVLSEADNRVMEPDEIREDLMNEYQGRSTEWLTGHYEAELEEKPPAGATRAQLIADIVDAKMSYFEANPDEYSPAQTRYGAAKYGQYQLPGGTNYREVLLTLPVKTSADPARAEYEAWAQRNGLTPNATMTEQRYERETGSAAPAPRTMSAMQADAAQNFKSSHWDQPNVLAHIRVNDRTDADGKRVLFVEEIQSDWGQSGKKQGFDTKADKAKRAELQAEHNRLQEEAFDLQRGKNYGDLTIEESGRLGKIRGRILQINDEMPTRGTPEAPFVTKTDAWLSLALKRIVKMAADGGYDRVAFVNGDQSAERYDLSKQVRSIVWTGRGNDTEKRVTITPNDGNDIEFMVQPDGAVGAIGRGSIGNEFDGKRLDDIVGKDVAERIMGAPYGDMRGNGLKVGGEGMKAFYDKIVPNTLKDVLKKVGGGALETVSIDTEMRMGEYEIYQRPAGDFALRSRIERTDAWSPNGVYPTREDAETRMAELKGAARKESAQPGFTLTPAMREKASGGLPMFAREAYTPANGQQQSTADFGPNAGSNIDTLNRAIARFLGKPGAPARPYQARRLRDHASLQGLASALGGTVQGFRVDPTLLGAQRENYGFFNGVYTAGTIFINEEAQRPHLAVLGHEFAHHLAKTDPIRYQQLVRAIRPFIDPAKYPAFARSSVGREHASNEDKLREEFVGEVLSDGFMNRDFWRAVGKYNPSLLQRIVRMVGELLNTALAKMGYTNRTEQYLTDFNKVMQVAGEVMGEYGLKVPSVTAGGGLSFSRGTTTAVATNDDVAGKSQGGRSAGDTSPSERASRQIVDAMRENGPSDYALRVIPGEFKGVINVGDTLPVSKQWNDGSETDENLRGTSVTRIRSPDEKAVFESLRNLGAAGKNGPNGYYYGDRVVLVEGESVGSGEDVGESLFKNAAVVGIWKKPTKGLSEIQPNESTAPNSDGAMSFNTKDGAAKTLRSVTDRLMEATSPIGTVSLWDKTVGTQYNKSTKDADFKRVFDGFYQQTDDTAHYAIESERHAPDILMRLDSLGDVWKGLVNSGSKQKADLAAVSKALFANIEGEEGIKQVEYDDRNLRELFKLTPRQIEMYRQARKAVNTSIERLAQTYAAQFGQEQGMSIDRLKNMSLEDTVASVKRKIQDDLDEAVAKAKLRASVAAEDKGTMTPELERAAKNALDARVGELQKKAAALTKRLDLMQEHASFLQENAYMPALRFGEYAVTVTQEDPDGKAETLHFEMFESQTAANLAAMRLRKEYPQANVAKSVLNKEQYAMFKGVSPETVSLFAKFTGVDQNEAVQNYIALAKSSRSVLMRQIRRKGIAGFSQDATRVLASFVTSNARQSAININQGAITDALASKSLARKGDVQLEAQKLAQYMNNPLEEARRLRGFMFMHFMGASVASALVNLTQPVMQTAPYLSQFAGGKTAGIMLSSARMAASGRIDNAELRDAAKRAAEDGITEPHEIHQLMADAGGSALGNNLRSRAAVKAWGSFFSLAEAYNRRVTFLAAYQVGQAQKHPDPFEFARIAVIETQGLYGKVNRPNWARGAVGATLFTFKQFSIAYIEFLRRLPPKQKLLALGILVLAAGLQGLPFAEDVEDIIDTIGQSLGYNTNSKKALRKFLVDNLGEQLGTIVDSGIFTQTTVDVQGRLGMGNLIPGTAIFKPSETNKAQTMSEVVGPLGGVLMAAQKALGAVQRGDYAGGVKEMLPVVGKNFLKGADMLTSGIYKDTRGYKVADVTAAESFMKMLGLQPGTIAEKTRRMSEQWQDKSMVTMIESMIADEWAKGVAEKDPDLVANARKTLMAWNERNPDSRIQIGFSQIRRRVQQMAQTREQRFIKTVPKELRAGVARELAQ